MNTISKTAQALARLDMSAEFDRLNAIEQERQETSDAYDRGRARTMELSQALERIREPKRDGHAEAEALRAGDDITTVAPSEDAVRAERDAVKAGMRALSADLDGLQREASEIQSSARAKLAGCFEGVVAAWDQEARTLLARLLEIFADASSVRSATSSAAATRLATALTRVIDEAAVANLIGRTHSAPASAATTDVIRTHSAVIKAAGGSVATEHRTLRM